MRPANSEKRVVVRGRALPTRPRLKATQAEDSLSEFVRQAWHVLEPGTDYVSGWHLDAICAHLEAVSKGELRNLLINVPPRHAKSLSVCVFWPAWEWATHPQRRWLFASYALSLSMRDSVKCRRLIESHWYRERWGEVFRLSDDQNQKTRYENDKTGYRIATSVGGTATGEGADVLVADDPHNVQEVGSDAMREAAVSWWDEVMSTRGNDPKTVARVVVMQRTHERDVSGHLLERGTYHHLCLPARYEPRVFVQPGAVAPKIQPHDDCPIHSDTRTQGELLWKERFGEAELRQLELDLGPYAAAGQLQQRPVPRTGAVFDARWFRPLPPDFAALAPRLNVVQFYDLAWSERASADYTAGVTLGIDPATQKLYVLHAWRQRVGEEGLDDALAEQIALQRPRLVGVELGAYRQAATQDLVRRLNRALSERRVATVVTAVRVSADKGFRAQVPAGRAQAGFLYADTTAPWWPVFQAELLAFPKGAHDDFVDSLSGAVQLAIERGRPLQRSGVQMLFGERELPPRERWAPDSPAAYLARLAQEDDKWPRPPPDPGIRLPVE